VGEKLMGKYGKHQANQLIGAMLMLGDPRIDETRVKAKDNPPFFSDHTNAWTGINNKLMRTQRSLST
jgi:hypothetical protein